MFETIEKPKFAELPQHITTDDPLWIMSLGQITRHNEDYWTDIEDILGKMLSSVMLSISSAKLPARSVTLALIDCMIFDVLSRRV